jgi:hypothetical protein
MTLVNGPCLLRRAGLAGLLVTLAPGCSFTPGQPTPAGHLTKVVVEGQSQLVTGQVTCVVGQTGEVNITVGDPKMTKSGAGAQPAIIVDLTFSNDTPYVSLLALNLPNIKLSIGQYREVAQPTVSRDGNSYRIIGQAAIADKPDQRSVYKSFEVDVTCP